MLKAILIAIIACIVYQTAVFAEQINSDSEYYKQVYESLKKLSENDYCITINLKTVNRDNYKDYFLTLKKLRPLLRNKKWKDNINGFYINHIRETIFESSVEKIYYTLKLEWFISNNDDLTLKIAKNFANWCGLIIKKGKGPEDHKVSDNYGGEELRMRKYLSIYTLIALDMIDNCHIEAKNKCNILLRPDRQQNMKPFKQYFDKLFDDHSDFYDLLLPKEKEQFWDDFDYWSGRRDQFDWIHFFINMVCGYDIDHIL